MSAGYPSRKEKRPRSANDVNNSFVKNVKSRMSGLLPSTITKWFGSPSSSKANGSAPVAESSDSSTEDEALDNSLNPPPSKRMRLGSSSNDLPETKCTGTNTEPNETFSIMYTPIGRSTFGPEKITTPISSANEETISEYAKDTPVFNSQTSYSSIGNKAIVKKRKSLFDVRAGIKVCDKITHSNSVLDCSQPCVKSSLLGSPFYSGKTRYGGASSSHYMNQPNIKQRKNTLLKKSAKDDNLINSHATRQVMDLLENYSSPLIEAKRISQFVKTSNSLDDSPNTNAYLTRELHVPSIAKILRLKQKSRLMATTSAARQIIASNSSSINLTPYEPVKSKSSLETETSDKLTTKLTTKITKVDQKDTQVNESAPIHLPTAVLEIDLNNIPKFTSGTDKPLCVTTTQTLVETDTNDNNSTTGNNTSLSTMNTVPVSTKTLIKPDDNINETATTVNDHIYEFSDPVMVHVKPCIENSTSGPNYTFGSPDRQTAESRHIENKKKIEESQSESWKCDDCGNSINSDSDTCVSCTAKKTIQNSKSIQIEKQFNDKTKHCSVCKVVLSQEHLEKCMDCEIKDKSTIKVTHPTSSSKWKCQDCWVSNDEGVDKCVCCGGKNPEAVPLAANASSEWKCDDCWIQNKNSAEKCAACGRAKPTSEQKKTNDCLPQPSSQLKISNDSAFKKIVNLQRTKWDCLNCLVQNSKDRSTCICCDTENPSNIKESAKRSFKFNSKSNSFKFGIEPNQNIAENKTVSLPESKFGTPVKESETNNNILPKPATFTFGISNQKFSEKTELETMAVQTTPKQTFTFGITKPIIPLAPATTNLFNSPVEACINFSPDMDVPSNSIDTDEKIQEVPKKEETNTIVPNQPQTPVDLFGMPLNTSLVTTAPSIITFGQTAINSMSQVVPSVITTTVYPKVSQSPFSFSASGNKPGLQIFPAVVTTASTFPTTQAPASFSFFQKSEPVHTSSMQFFSKPKPIASSLSLFNKKETMTTTVAPSILSSAPVFSFGATAQNTQPEKPKFNFTFGSKPETSLFGLQASNTNILSGNSMSSGNIISTGNALQTASTIGRNNLLSNSLSSGLLGRPAKENVMWSSNNDSIKMSSGNNLDQGINNNNNLPAIQPANPFSVQAKKDDVWSLKRNISNDSMGSLQLPTGNNVDSANNATGAAPGGIFGAPDKKENMWSLNNNNSNLFAPNAVENLQKPAAFSFGSSMQFNSNNARPAPTFRTSPTTQNIFGISSQGNHNQPDMFSSSVQNQPPTNMFGAQNANNNNAPAVGMFGSLNANATPTFGNPTFETTPLSTIPTPTFNFGAQQTTGVFGFGQQQPQPVQQGGIYNFGAMATSTPQRQFNIGTAGGTSNTARRPMRRAVRRSNIR